MSFIRCLRCGVGLFACVFALRFLPLLLFQSIAVITHPLAGTCFWCKISRLHQYGTATALKVIIGEMPMVRRVAKPVWSSLLERYWPETEHLSNELGSAV